MLGLLALVTASIFFGAAVYISLVEHPARLLLDDAALLAQWRPAYRRGFAMQASLAVVSALLGAAAWWASGDPLWALGAAIVISNWPYTLAVIMPVNQRLEGAEQAGPDTRALIIRWGRLHAVRSLLGGLATLTYLLAALGAL